MHHAPKAALLFALLGRAMPVDAAAFRIASTAGLMQQPTSNYYLAVYGASAEVASSDDALILRAAYIERPAFRTSGYIDQEYGWFALAGTKVTKSKQHGLYAFIGGGQMLGYIKVDPRSGSGAEQVVRPQTRSFALSGLSLALDYDWQWGQLTSGLGHQTFIGYVDDVQLEARVAWPYNFLQAHLGYAW